jgi:CTP:molybdopterin cytidylyltransferase MocA
MTLAAIVLAAGASTRLNEPKQLMEVDGVSLVRRAVIAAHDAGADRVFVVLGHEASRVSKALEGLDYMGLVFNESWQTGIASSLRAGLSAAAEYDAALITLADQPLVDAGILRTLLETFSPDRRIVASAYDGTLGVPVVVGSEHFPALMSLEGDRGAGVWLRAAPDVTPIPFDAPAFDIDTPADLARLRTMRGAMDG